MLNWSKDDKDIEGQADLFASYLLMPLDDYRKQVTTTVDLGCARALR
jgi:Zn-dependent peptidase ImmA (M78 family)